ncbi:MAG TPA: sugar transferase [Dermatophilaceae bacterium]|jgi:exopolysaccharide biosynthesis polyprenyl glycosylphosphotransferase
MAAARHMRDVVADAEQVADVASAGWQRWMSPLVRYGITPYLVAADCFAFLVAVTAVKATSITLWTLLPVILLFYSTGGLFRSRLTLSALDDLPSLLGRAFAAAAVVTWLGALASHLYVSEMLRCSAFFAVAVVIGRAGLYSLVHQARARRLVSHPTLILGAGRVGGQVADFLAQHRQYGLRPVGFLDEHPLLRPSDCDVPVIGKPADLAAAIQRHGVQDVIVAFSNIRESAMVDVIRTCDRLDCEIFFVPRLFELGSALRDLDHVWGVPLVRMKRATFRTFSWRLKRLFDVALALASLVVLAPVLVVCGLAVRLESGPGVLFRQERVGLDGKPFMLLKFRSLRPATQDESATRWSIALDDRLRPVGRLLRKTSLDELPQLLNVLRGQMSIVGPRPERPHFVEQFTSEFPAYLARHRVPSGLTGMSQVHGLRGNTSIEDRARLDNYYIEHWSLWADIKIMARTAGAVLRGTGS